MKKLAIQLILLILFSSCQEKQIIVKESRNELKENSFQFQPSQKNSIALSKAKQVNQNHQKTSMNPNYERCQQWFMKRRKLDSLKYDLFVENIYEPNIKNQFLGEANKEFLEKLKLALENNDLDKLLFPVYKLTESNCSIVSWKQYEWDLLKQKLKSDSIHFKNNILSGKNEKIIKIDSSINRYEPIVYYSSLDSLKKIKNINDELFLFGLNSYSKCKVENVGFVSSDCLEFISYEIPEFKYNENFKPLFATNEFIEVEYINNPIVDHLYEEYYKDSCFDCVYKYEPRISFAKLEGIENLNFCYADTFPTSKYYDYPTRTLTMNVGDTVMIDLWLENIDLFGCSCL